MDPWDLHVFYPALDVKSIPRYPNKPHPKAFNIWWFSLGYCPHDFAFMGYISKFEVMIRLFIYSLLQDHNGHLKHSWCMKTIPSLKALIEGFLKHCGPRWQRYEDTFQCLLAALQQEGLLDLLEGNDDIDEDEKQGWKEFILISFKWMIHHIMKILLLF